MEQSLGAHAYVAVGIDGEEEEGAVILCRPEICEWRYAHTYTHTRVHHDIRRMSMCV